MELTAAQIRYLVTICRLAEDGAVRSTDIADRLGVSRPSVHRMLAQLSSLGLLEKGRYAPAVLTGPGRTLAEAYDACYTDICGLLCGGLGLSPAAAGEGALAVLGGLTPEELGRIRRRREKQEAGR